MSKLPSIEDMDYVIHRGQSYQVQHDHFNHDTYLLEVDEIPDDYWERWEGETNE